MTEQTNTATITELLDRIVSLEEERDVVSADIKSVWAEARAQGFTKELRKAHSIRKMDPHDRAVLGVYVRELGLFD